MATDAVVRLAGVGKSYGASRVLDDVSFAIRRGRVHALVGENGAGKSTLVKIITGVVARDAGEVLVGGQPVHFSSPLEARAVGIAAVYQDPRLFPDLDVAENIYLTNYPTTRLGTVDRGRMYRSAADALATLGVDVDPRAVVASLTVAQLQFVEIARALTTDVQLLILDEPTAALTPDEAERLFAIVRRLRARGSAILLITHRLEEVERIADDITVLRDGRHVATRPAASLDRATLVHMMVGRDLSALFARRRDAEQGREVLRVERLTLAGTFAEVSFALHAGEILGMGGLVGAGRSEIAQAIFGMTPPSGGRIWLNGQEIAPRGPRQMLAAGLAYLPEDRDGQGLIMPEPVVDNIVLPILGRLARLTVRNRAAERQLAERAVATYRVRTPGIAQPVASLSGGNRQKVAFAKWLATAPAVLILDEPTHGVDIGSKAQIHDIIAELALAGLAVLLISSDLPELLAISDRILVVADGRVVAEFPGAEATQERVMQAATSTRLGRHVAA
jgi:rhamnose transport system ATP-binding protein